MMGHQCTESWWYAGELFEPIRGGTYGQAPKSSVQLGCRWVFVMCNGNGHKATHTPIPHKIVFSLKFIWQKFPVSNGGKNDVGASALFWNRYQARLIVNPDAGTYMAQPASLVF